MIAGVVVCMRDVALLASPDVCTPCSAAPLAHHVRHVLDDGVVAVRRLRTLGHGSQTGDGLGRVPERTFLLHALEFALLGLGELGRDHDEAQVDHEEGADDDQEDEVDPVPEAVRVLDVVHDLRPSFQGNHEEDGSPGHTHVIERDRALEWVHTPCLCLSVDCVSRVVVVGRECHEVG